MSLHHYRVIVRGVFDGLDDDQRARLRADAPAHDIFSSAFTEAGTLTYDHFLHAFNARFALRASASPAENEEEVTAVALERTETHLAALGVGGRRMRVQITDMADMWGSRGRRDRRVVPGDRSAGR